MHEAVISNKIASNFDDYKMHNDLKCAQVALRLVSAWSECL